jgi:hypothetical protein
MFACPSATRWEVGRQPAHDPPLPVSPEPGHEGLKPLPVATEHEAARGTRTGRKPEGYSAVCAIRDKRPAHHVQAVLAGLRGVREHPGAAGVLDRQHLAAGYERAVVQQRARQNADPAARTLATRCTAAFFSVPLIGDRSKIEVVVDNTSP